MKRVVSVSLGSSTRDKKIEAEFDGEQFSVERIGTDGSMEEYARLLREIDGKVDAIGLGGIDMYVYAGSRRYAFRDALRLARNVEKTPVVDGSGLKNTLERETIRLLAAEGVIDFAKKKTLLVSGVDRFGMAEGLVACGGPLIFGDFMFTLGLNVPIRSFGVLKFLAAILLPIIVRLPFKWIYPTGKKQEEIKPKWGKYYAWADVICGDFHLIRKNLPESLTGKAIVTNTTTSADQELLAERGLQLLVTTTPEFSGRSFGTNVMEGVLVALSGKNPKDLSGQHYMDTLRRLGWRPNVKHFGSSRAKSSEAVGASP